MRIFFIVCRVLAALTIVIGVLFGLMFLGVYLMLPRHHAIPHTETINSLESIGIEEAFVDRARGSLYAHMDTYEILIRANLTPQFNFGIMKANFTSLYEPALKPAIVRRNPMYYDKTSNEMRQDGRPRWWRPIELSHPEFFVLEHETGIAGRKWRIALVILSKADGIMYAQFYRRPETEEDRLSIARIIDQYLTPQASVAGDSALSATP